MYSQAIERHPPALRTPLPEVSRFSRAGWVARVALFRPLMGKGDLKGGRRDDEKGKGKRDDEKGKGTALPRNAPRKAALKAGGTFVLTQLEALCTKHAVVQLPLDDPSCCSGLPPPTRVADLGKGKDRDGKGGKAGRGNLVERGAEGVVVSKKEKSAAAGSEQPVVKHRYMTIYSGQTPLYDNI